MGKLMKSYQLGWMTGLPMLLALAASSCVADYPAEYLMSDPELPSRCFRATGHTVSGDFLRYFEFMGGIEALGYPITEPFEQEGRQVQYFEYARIEAHPDNPKQPVVKLSMLGERLGRRQPPLSSARVPPAFDRSSRYYPQMGHALSGDFLTYFDRYGGWDRFGLPIGEPLISEGKLVQDLQRARLVWHPDRPPGGRVTLEPSGHIYFEAQDLDPALLAPVSCPPDADMVSPSPNQPGPSPRSR
jgi:hypothetical protein